MAQKINKHMGIALSDLHIPFHDKYACRLALQFIRDHQPGKVHLLGDIDDFYSISRFDKDPLRKERLQDDLDSTYTFLSEVREAAGGQAKIIYSEGNHENRLARFLRSQAPELASLRCLQLPELLGFEKLNIVWRSMNQPYKVGSLLYTHGSRIRRWSAYTARAHWEKYGCCVLHGHSHRMGAFYHRDLKDTWGAWENGCLCSLNPEYEPNPDWQQGWSVIWSHREYFHVEPVQVIKGRFNYHGKMYGRKRLSPTAHFVVENL